MPTAPHHRVAPPPAVAHAAALLVALATLCACRLGDPAALEPAELLAATPPPGPLERALADPLRAFAKPSLWRTLGGARPLTLQSAIERALARSPELAIAAERRVRTRVERIRAWAQLLPRAAVAYDRFEQRPQPPGLAGGLRTDELQARLDTTRLVLRWPLFDGFSRLLDPARGAAREHAAQARQQAARLLVIAACAARYFDVLEADALAEIETRYAHRLENWAAAIAPSATAQALFAAERAHSAQRLTHARNARLRARAELALLIEGPVAERLAPPHLAARARLRALAAASLPAVVEAGLARRPDLRALAHEVNAARLGARMTLLETQLPSAEIQSNLYLARGGLRGNTRWDLAILVRQELFAGFAGSARAIAAHSRLRERIERRRERLRAAAEEIASLWFLCRTHRDALPHAEARAGAAESALAAQRLRVAGPDPPLPDLLALLELARRAYAAERALARERIGRERDLLALALATGEDRLLEPTGPTHAP